MCSLCLGYYMLEYGYYGIVQWSPNVTIDPEEGMYETSGQTHIITDPKLQCHECPWGGGGGGICNDSVRAKPNHWGLVKDNKIFFFGCPNSYCCSKTHCEGINKCATHRTGILCGRCKEGYSDALFFGKMY